MILIQSLLSPSEMGILVLVLLAGLGCFVYFVKRNSSKSVTSKVSIATVDDYVASHGEPDDVIVLDATRSNELDAVVLVYGKYLVIEGKLVERDKITGITFYNAQNPYVTSEYHLVVNTTIPETPSVETPIGSDAQYAEDIVAQLSQHLNL